MSNLFQTSRNRAAGEKIPLLEEIERFGSDGEESLYRTLKEHFDCVIRNVVVPHKSLYLEKDFLVIERGVPFVLEAKNWKGEIGEDGGMFYQSKDNGVRKTLKSPVGTTNQFLHVMKKYYKIDRPVWGVVVFTEPDCRLNLPKEQDGIRLLTAKELVSYIRTHAKETACKEDPPIDTDLLLRCTRFYSRDSEFCKGILADTYLDCTAEDGARVKLDTTRLRYLSVEPQSLRLRDKLYVTYLNGESGVFYNRDLTLTVGCLDGSYRKIALNRIRHIVF
ncbi:MAG: NERD domain-containing protein [Clostridia bacterium]|nr:NERD domain-containing protein [Clostridia bacterium]